MPRPTTPTCVMFDFDGVISDTEARINQVFIDIIREEHGVELELDDLIPIVGTNGTEALDTLMIEHGMPAQGAHLLEEYTRRGDVHEVVDLTPFPGVIHFIASLRDRNIPVGLVSTTASPLILAALDHMGIVSLFDSIVCGDMVANHKPHPEPYLTTLHNLGCTSDGAVVFEDSKSGIASAKLAGAWVIGFCGGSVLQDTSAADESIDTFVGMNL